MIETICSALLWVKNVYTCLFYHFFIGGGFYYNNYRIGCKKSACNIYCKRFGFVLPRNLYCAPS